MLVLTVELDFCNEDEIKTAMGLSIEISKSLSKFTEYLNARIKE